MKTADTIPAAKLHHPSLSDIRLIPGTPFYERQQDMNEFLLAQDADQMLYNFRKACGLSVRGAAPMTGWDADECKLKGHTTGHFMSGLALAYAASGDERFRDKLNYIAESLAECQAAFAGMPDIHPGFLSAYSEEQFDLLEQYTKYPEIWAPYYTLDKIMAGLLDAYELAGIGRALDILGPLGDWVYRRLSRLPEEQRSRMWSMYIAGEYGGMIGTMVRLYRHTGKADHLAAAGLFENPRLFDQMSEGRDELDTMHANQHIPQIIGALELYSVTGDQRYLRIASCFEQTVTSHHYYAIGGTGESELFHAADTELEYLTEKTAESCASVNMLRLQGRLHEYLPSASLMEHYENTLFNHILMSFSHRPDGGTTYFLPLAPGSVKHYELEENSCCHGTGLESRYRYMTDIFSYDDSTLRVELPVSATLKAAHCGIGDVTVTYDNSGVLEIRADSDLRRALAVRVPAWADDTAHPLLRDGYLIYPDGLKKGESVKLDLPLRTRRIRMKADSGIFVLARGPHLLAEVCDDSSGRTGADGCENSSDHDGKELRDHSDANPLLPLYAVDEQRYHIYFRSR